MIVAPLVKLLRKNVPFIWTDEQQACFEKLKSVLTRAAVLIQFKSGKEFIVHSDAFHTDLNYVLM